MFEYHGFNIPETREEMIKVSRPTPVPSSFPCVVLFSSDEGSNLRLTTPISTEDINHMDDSQIEQVIEEFEKIAIAYERSNRPKIKTWADIQSCVVTMASVTLIGDDGLRINAHIPIETSNRQEVHDLISRIVPTGYEYVGMSIDFFERESDIPSDKPHLNGWYETKKEIEKMSPRIITTQMGLLGTELIEMGYRVYVHPANEESYEIRMDDLCTCTEKEIRPAHNLFRMWQAGAFHANSVKKEVK
ncbi:MAG: hypothetical protein NC548_28340 [Lachnospiraceae bacterium]|nr:hypothetical protein [Lachnospiraceae bacterium]MCM1231999.1 hypothetical protein [Ruminococcus flavefaciens]